MSAKLATIMLFLLGCVLTIVGFYLMLKGTGPIFEAQWLFLREHSVRIVFGFTFFMMGILAFELTRLAALDYKSNKELIELDKRRAEREANRTIPRKPNELADLNELLDKMTRS